MLTYRRVNAALAALPGWNGEELVQGEGYLYFYGGRSSEWFTATIPVCKLNHCDMETVLDYFKRYSTGEN